MLEPVVQPLVQLGGKLDLSFNFFALHINKMMDVFFHPFLKLILFNERLFRLVEIKSLVVPGAVAPGVVQLIKRFDFFK